MKYTVVVMLGLMAGALSARAQWITQSITLNSGWNAIYLHVDASYTTLQDLIGSAPGNPISDVWIWNPAPSSTQLPATDNSQWASWSRTNNSGSLLQRLVGNAAYLVCVTNTAGYTWKIKGRPVPPSYQWTSSGVNLIGFPTATNGTPTIDTFLAQAPDLKNNAQIYQYKGGSQGSISPSAVNSVLWRATTLKRGQAYWFCKTNFYNTYYGPFAVDLSNAKGIDFSDAMSVSKFSLRNQTTNSLTVTLKLAASETQPAGQAQITGVPPLLVRGSLNATNLTYACSNLTTRTATSWKLAPKGLAGSQVDVVLGLNRTLMTGQAGDLQAGVLSFTDSLGFTKLDVPVAASVSSSAGLWVGSALITQVGEYLKSYAYDTNGLPMVTTNMPSTNVNYGAYIVTNTTTRLGSVKSPYPLRLIVHNPSNGPAILLQRVYCGLDANSNAVVATQEASLDPASLSSARRISASHLPWTAGNTRWAFSDNLDQANITTVLPVTTAYDDQAANPFLHTYHPDHDNRDAFFNLLPGPGMESYTIQRAITLCATNMTSDFDAQVSKNKTISGNYSETITVIGLQRSSGNDQRVFKTSGVFSLNRITDVAILTPSTVIPPPPPLFN